ncbi:MAG TPA: NAD(P)-dependent oxidoreductase [Gemmatimonadaceae bacterium]|nr:NAD(P)-dependent oxidoreductase [Gemmatimonadaceae bacterium]
MIDARFTEPREETLAALRDCPGDVVVLGAGGKMGPSLTAMLARAVAALGGDRRVVAVSRWSDRVAKSSLESMDVVTVECDLLNPDEVALLPAAPNVIFMAGQKFGTDDRPSLTWAMNTLVPANAARRYAGSRVVAFSTGNVYPLTPVASGGARETDPVAPVGEYAMSCVGRERVFEFFSDRDATRFAIFRLNYAIDVRYGVLLDLAQRVAAGEAIPLAMGYVNVIWQGDANRIAIECLPRASAPPFVLNVTGRETLSVRGLAELLGRRLGREPVFAGTEGSDALLSNAELMHTTFTPPATSVAEMIEHVAVAVEQDAPTLGKPTHFEARDGRF